MYVPKFKKLTVVSLPPIRHLWKERNAVLIEILPSDIVGFTAMAAQSSPMQVILFYFYVDLK